MASRASSVISDYSLHSEASQSPAPSVSRTRRWASTSEAGDDDGEEDSGAPVNKRRAAGGRKGVGASTLKGAAAAALVKATPVEKEQRKEARMVRNRNAAQASRDRKKEHTQLLEMRVAELEQQLASKRGPAHPSMMAPSLELFHYPPPRSQRSASIESTGSTSRILALEDENDVLRSQLEQEMVESSALRERLEGLEHQFIRMEGLLSNSPDSIPLLPLPLATYHASPSTLQEPSFHFDPSTEEDQDVKPTLTEMILSPTMTDSSRLVAAEAVPIVEDSITTPVDFSSPSSPSSNFDSFTDTTGTGETLDDFEVGLVWQEWASGLSAPAVKEEFVEESLDTPLEFFDFTRLTQETVA